MGLYNLLFGVNPQAETLLNILKISPEKSGRVRDVYVNKTPDGKYIIVLFTRNGGDNRLCWEFDGCKNGKHDKSCMVSVIENLKSHPLYIQDYDIPEDPTYASFEFKVPPDKIELVEHIYDTTEDKRAPMKKFNDIVTKIEKGNTSDPEVAKALNIGKNILNKVIKKSKGRKA